MELSVFLFFITGAFGFNFYDTVDPGRECHPGERADPGIKFFVNTDRMEAYPFFYKGCGGNSNRFETKEDAAQVFDWIADFWTCPGWVPSSKPCGGPYGNCSKNEFCTNHAWPDPACCDANAAERFNQNRRAAKCGFRMQAVQRYPKDGQIFFGQNCSHNFCQEGATCIQEEFEAYCCLEGPDSGHTCGTGEAGIPPGIRYYHDFERDTIYPFYYRGCGGLLNHAASPHELPLIADLLTCPGFLTYGRCLDEDYYPNKEDAKRYPENKQINKNCTGDLYCLANPMGPFGFCCSKDAQARYLQNRKAAKCGRYESVVKYPGTKDVFFGRKCSDNFCPKHAKCIQEEFEAYCCANEPDQGRECNAGEKGEKPGIRYFLDEERNEAYPFFYLGCGGNRNRFPNATAARNDGNPDWKMCPGFANAANTCSKFEGCYDGYHCQMSRPDYGKCCPDAVRDRYLENRKADRCNKDMMLRPQRDQKTGEIIFGRNCSHDFCERGADCVQDEFEAYCCVSEPDPGHKCGITEKGTTPGVYWYFDLQRVYAYPFYYKGCGGNERNRFANYEDIPHITDNGLCPGFDLGDFCAGNSPEGPWSRPCQEGYYCHPHSGHSTCCSTSVKNRYSHGIDPVHFCPEGYKGLQPHTYNVTFALMGKSCAHNFCQAGSVCVQEEFSAYCCLM